MKQFKNNVNTVSKKNIYFITVGVHSIIDVPIISIHV